MAFGIDDALTTAAAGISLTDTIVEIVKRYRRTKVDYDLEQLLEEVRLSALKRIDDADLALTQFERTLVDKKVNISRRLSDVIAEAPFWKPFEQYRLSQIQKRFREFYDSIYCSSDDIAALVRCREQTREMDEAVVQSTKAKHELHAKLMHAPSLKRAIELLRGQLVKQKAALSR